MLSNNLPVMRKKVTSIDIFILARTLDGKREAEKERQLESQGCVLKKGPDFLVGNKGESPVRFRGKLQLWWLHSAV